MEEGPAPAGDGQRRLRDPYQPVVELARNEECADCEAMLRWPAIPERGIDLAGRIIPVAEDAGIMKNSAGLGAALPPALRPHLASDHSHSAASGRDSS